MSLAVYGANTGSAPEAFTFNAPEGPHVDHFTGDLSYSIPLLTVQSTGGLQLPLSLSYSAGIGVESEASWVGLGWFLSGGAITRDINGIPDDYASERNAHNRVKHIPKNEPPLAEGSEKDQISAMKKALEMDIPVGNSIGKIGHASSSASFNWGGGGSKGYAGNYQVKQNTGFDDGFFYTVGCSSSADRNTDCTTADTYKVTAPGLNEELIIVGDDRRLNQDSTKRFATKNPNGRITEGRDDPIKVTVDRGPHGEFIGFIITDKRGLTYHFDYPVKHVNRNGEDAGTGEYCNADHVHQTVTAGEMTGNMRTCDMLKQSYAYAWYITKIEDPNGNYVEFNYDTYNPHFWFRTPFGPGFTSPSTSFQYKDGPVGENFQSNDGTLEAVDGWMELAVLTSIETPVYKAEFITGDRLDAVEYDDKASTILTHNEPASKFIGEGRKKYLDEIKVYVKDESGKPHNHSSWKFTYDYSLANGIPDTVSTEEGNKGKLTLKELQRYGENWTLPPNPSPPYQFEYANNDPPGSGKNPNYLTGDSIIQSQGGTYRIEDLAPSGLKFPTSRRGFTPEFIGGTQYSDYRTDISGLFWEDGNMRNHRMEDGWFDGRHDAVYFDQYTDPLIIKKNSLEGLDAWSLTKISYPTGASTSIAYEIDRYAYVGREPTILAIGNGEQWLGVGVEMRPDGVFIENTDDDTRACPTDDFFDRSRQVPFPIEVSYFSRPGAALSIPPTRQQYYDALGFFLEVSSESEREVLRELAQEGDTEAQQWVDYFDSHHVEDLPASIMESNRVLHYGGGIRVKQLTNFDGFEYYTTKYHYKNSVSDIRTEEDAFTSSGVLSKPNFPLRQKLPTVLGYRTVIEEQPNGGLIEYSFTSPYDQPIKKVFNFIRCYSQSQGIGSDEHYFVRLRDPAYFWDYRDTFQDTSYLWGQEISKKFYDQNRNLVREITTEYLREPQEELEWVEYDPVLPELRKESFLPYFVMASKVTTTTDGVSTSTETSYADNGLTENVITASEMGVNARIERTEYETSNSGMTARHIIDKPKRVLSGKLGDSERGTWLTEEITEYDPLGNRLTVTAKSLDGRGSDRVTRYEYDTHGNVEKTTDANGNTAEIRFQRGYLPWKGWDNMEWNSENNPAWVNTYDKFGRIINMRDANGNSNSYVYDVMSRLIKVIKPGDSIGSPSVSYEYASDSLPLIRKTSTKMDSDQRNDLIEYYDGHARVIQSHVKEGGSSYLVSETTYDTMGEPERTYRVYRANTNGEFQAAAPPADYILSTYYRDPLKRIKEVHPIGGSVILNEYSKERDSDDSYDYKTTILTDELGYQLLTKTDHFDNVIEIKQSDLDTGMITENSFVTKSHYDVLGRLTGQESDLGHASTIHYNSFGDIWRTTHPDLGTVETTYDGLGNPLTKETALGRISYEYDELNRVKLVSYPDGSTYSYIYDTGGITDCTNGLEKVCTIEGDFGRKGFDYNQRGLVSQIVYEIGGVEYSVSYEYDSSDNVKIIRDPVGVEAHYDYNDANLLTSIRAMYPDGTGEIIYTYTPTSMIDDATFSNGIITDYEYTGRDWLKSFDTVGNGRIFGRSYDFDSTGNIIGLKNGAGSQLASFDYDKLYRLTKVTDSGFYGTHISFDEYDAVGNRLSMTKDGVSYNYLYDYMPQESSSKSIQLKKITSNSGTTALNYDGAGNLIRKGDQIFSYDAENRLRCFEDYAYLYDEEGQRVLKVRYLAEDKALVTVYIYGMGGNLVYEKTLESNDFNQWRSLLQCERSLA